MNAATALQMMDTCCQNAEDTACRGNLSGYMVGYYIGTLNVYAALSGAPEVLERAEKLRTEIRELAASVLA